MGLLDFVEEHDGIRLTTDRFGELATFVVTHVTRRRTDEAGDRELLHVLGHIDLNDRLLFAEHTFGQRAGEERLADAGGAEEEEGADRATGVLEVGTRPTEGTSDDFAGALLADDGRLQVLLELEELLGLLLLEPVKGHAGPIGDDVEHLIFTDDDALLVALLAPLFEHLLALGAEFLLGIPEVGGFLELLMAGGVFLLLHDLVDLGLHRVDVGRDV